MNNIDTLIKEKGIDEIIHFTTNNGFLGILSQNQVLPNSRLTKEDTLEYIFKQNSEKRKERDLRWLDYVNLSISKVNKEFFSYSVNRHKMDDGFWVILSFSPEILEHDGVYFTTTNNIYPSCKRGTGKVAFLDMFANPVEGKFQRLIYRDVHLDYWTTCEQAEVLYPNELSLKYLNRIYVKDLYTKHSVTGQLSAFDMNCDVIVDPDKFKIS